MISLRSGLCILAHTGVSLQKVVPLGIHTNAAPGESGSWGLIYKAEDNMGQFCRRCNPKQRGPYLNIRANEHKWRPIGSNENMPWVVVVTSPREAPPMESNANWTPQSKEVAYNIWDAFDIDR